MTKNIDYNTTLEVTDDEGSIHLLMNIKCKVTVPKTSSPIQNTKKSHKSCLMWNQFEILPIKYRDGHRTQP